MIFLHFYISSFLHSRFYNIFSTLVTLVTCTTTVRKAIHRAPVRYYFHKMCLSSDLSSTFLNMFFTLVTLYYRNWKRSQLKIHRTPVWYCFHKMSSSSDLLSSTIQERVCVQWVDKVKACPCLIMICISHVTIWNRIQGIQCGNCGCVVVPHMYEFQKLI